MIETFIVDDDADVTEVAEEHQRAEFKLLPLQPARASSPNTNEPEPVGNPRLRPGMHAKPNLNNQTPPGRCD
jgi:hypothetical protein